MPRVAKTETKEKVVAAKPVEKTSGLSVPVYTLAGAKKGTVSLNKEIFGTKINTVLMNQAVRVYLVNQRQGTASTKTRGEVNLTTAKWYRQKGTGRARHGAKSAPIFVGGGVAMGPRPRDFDLKLSKQMRNKALFSALSSKVKESSVLVVDTKGATGKTKEVASLLKALELTTKPARVLFVGSDKAARAARNINGVDVRPANVMNTYEVLKNKRIVISQDALPLIEEAFLGGKK